jgi:hypothetical protein
VTGLKQFEMTIMNIKHKLQEGIQRTMNFRQAARHHPVQNIVPTYLFPKIIRNEKHKTMTAYWSVWLSSNKMTRTGNGGYHIKKNYMTYCAAI